MIRTYEKLRLEHYFPDETRLPLRALGSHWRLLPPKTSADRYRLVPARFPASEIIRPGAVETTAWSSDNDFGPQPLRVRIECLPALAPYAAKDNVTVADFATAQFHAAENSSAKTVFERTSEVHPQAGAVARFACMGPPGGHAFPPQAAGR